ncbi:beta-lactamase/transpeptidase-like protein [Lentithecium fluviatile CBS 122367]|uniref:Beta-lactamase/transpeptidase-like protein n=1 Tax=Lentithecium fluviatile CBS 122367 TaxID=1168545 RepID=A0A6G1IVH3_9PLEO|nr:beta-lactamase/transpeptidase-like protein [Lentithecium fluviatile CBS 122367]
MARSLLLLPLVSVASAFCPWYGPVFPQAKNLASSATIQTALEKLKSTYDTGLLTGNSSADSVPNSSAASVQIFSVESEKPLFEYYHDGAVLNTTVGVKTLDGESIIRIASISKLITVYLWLKEIGDGWWDVPVTDVIPELKGAEKWEENEVDFIKWEDVTIGALAGQTSGILGNFVQLEGADPLVGHPEFVVQLGLPPLEPSEEPACTLAAGTKIGLTCSRQEFFASLATSQPVRRPNTSPAYSSTAFVVLGYALETMTGKSYKQVVQSLADALELTGFSVDTPEVSKGAILTTLEGSDFRRPTGGFAPTGGLYSSMNDLSQIGRSILGSKFLDPNTTRAWLKPAAFTSDLRSALGRPWEIYRVDTKSSRGVIDVFAKGGDYGLYHTKFVLIPDYNIGYTAFVGGPGEKDWLGDQIIDILLPALEEVAREQTDAAYAATYTTTTNGSAASMTLTTEAGKPGLGIEKWTQNGTDILKAFSQLSEEPLSTENIRLLPTNLERKMEGGGTEIAWRALISTSHPYEKRSVFGACPAWFNSESIGYGRHTLDQISFTLGSDGKATKVSPRAWKVDLQRKD